MQCFPTGTASSRWSIDVGHTELYLYFYLPVLQWREAKNVEFRFGSDSDHVDSARVGTAKASAVRADIGRCEQADGESVRRRCGVCIVFEREPCNDAGWHVCVIHRKAAQDRERDEELAEAQNEEADEDDEDNMDAEDDAEDEEAAAGMKEDDDVELPPELDMDNYDNEKEIDLLEALDNDDDGDDDDMDEDDDDMAGALEVRAWSSCVW